MTDARAVVSEFIARRHARLIRLRRVSDGIERELDYYTSAAGIVVSGDPNHDNVVVKGVFDPQTGRCLGGPWIEWEISPDQARRPRLPAVEQTLPRYSDIDAPRPEVEPHECHLPWGCARCDAPLCDACAYDPDICALCSYLDFFEWMGFVEGESEHSDRRDRACVVGAMLAQGLLAVDETVPDELPHNDISAGDRVEEPEDGYRPGVAVRQVRAEQGLLTTVYWYPTDAGDPPLVVEYTLHDDLPRPRWPEAVKQHGSPLPRPTPGYDAMMVPGTRVHLSGSAMRNMGDMHETEQWMVAPCDCTICTTGRFVRLDNGSHMAKAALVIHGRPHHRDAP